MQHFFHVFVYLQMEEFGSSAREPETALDYLFSFFFFFLSLFFCFFQKNKNSKFYRPKKEKKHKLFPLLSARWRVKVHASIFFL